MDRILKAKHWLLFLLLVGVPIIAFIVLMISMISSMIMNIGNMNNVPNMNAFAFLAGFKYMSIAILIIVLIYFAWFWAMGVSLQNKISVEMRFQTGLFKASLIVPTVFLVFISILFISILPSSHNETQMMFPWMGFIPLFIFPLELLAYVCGFYCIFFAARTIKTAELGRVAKFEDYAAVLLMIWFVPIGIWFLQPRLNKLVIDDTNNQYQPGSDFMLK